MKTKLITHNSKFKTIKGFTLIELLIVVAIISILSTLLMVNFIAVRQRGRDAERKSNLRQVQSALELYRADQDTYTLVLANCNSGTGLGSPTCSTIYMNKLPKDPNGGSYYNSGNYYYTTDGTTYSLVACVENTADKDSNITQTPPSGAPTDCSSGFYYVLQNP
jgi:general secretion pathway protein G